jgi:hypothetical protein
MQDVPKLIVRWNLVTDLCQPLSDESLSLIGYWQQRLKGHEISKNASCLFVTWEIGSVTYQDWSGSCPFALRLQFCRALPHTMVGTSTVFSVRLVHQQTVRFTSTSGLQAIG